MSDFLLNVSDELDKEKRRIDAAAEDYKRVRREVDESWQLLLLGRKIEHGKALTNARKSYNCTELE